MRRLCYWQTMQVNCEDRGLARFVDVRIEMQSELDKTVTTATQQQALDNKAVA